MEASLLPSDEIRALANEIPMAVVPRGAASAPYMREFGVEIGNSWVVVLDARGETIDSFMGDTAASGCTAEGRANFGGLLATRIRKGLEETVSLQDLERAWDSTHAEADLAALLARLEGSYARRRAAQICDAAAADGTLPPETRTLARFEAFLARSRTPAVFQPGEPRTRFLAEGEALLRELPAHPRSASVVPPLVSTGHGDFDVPGKTQGMIDRLAATLPESPDRAALQARIDELVALRQRAIEQRSRGARPDEREIHVALRAVWLGDAQTVVTILCKPEYAGNPRYAAWLAEAREKLAQTAPAPGNPG